MSSRNPASRTNLAARSSSVVVYKLYGHHKMALFISLALSLTVIPVLWVISKLLPEMLWYSYLIAYVIEVLLIVLFHKISHIKFVLPEK